ncbi:hypothetical protein, partial [uncultured Pseudokineococcus sp.]|uniref:hypothetical protein n=1 Tax=uncultured Pseudokineococcus sp. TaxID=1642928 RepID=UPI002626F874
EDLDPHPPSAHDRRVVTAPTAGMKSPITPSLREPVTAVRPTALRGCVINVFVGAVELSDRCATVQSVNVSYRVSLDRHERLGNAQIVNQHFDAQPRD